MPVCRISCCSPAPERLPLQLSLQLRLQLSLQLSLQLPLQLSVQLQLSRQLRVQLSRQLRMQLSQQPRMQLSLQLLEVPSCSDAVCYSSRDSLNSSHMSPRQQAKPPPSPEALPQSYFHCAHGLMPAAKQPCRSNQLTCFAPSKDRLRL